LLKVVRLTLEAAARRVSHSSRGVAGATYGQTTEEPMVNCGNQSDAP
jgi:hypothetical protein